MGKTLNYNGIERSCAIGGTYTIIDNELIVDHMHMVDIKFHNLNIFGFNTVVTVRATNAINGKVKDIYAPYVLGVGCTGDISNYNKTDPYYECMYTRWQNMLKKHVNQNYILEPDWRCLEIFLRDVTQLDGYNDWMQHPDLYIFDRDYKLGYKFNGFTRQSCSFVHFSINSNKEYIRLAQANGTYIGVREKYGNRYHVSFGGMHLGSYTNPIAAASAYNHCARRNGYVEEAINNLGPLEIPLQELEQYQVEPEKLNGLNQMYTIFVK